MTALVENAIAKANLEEASRLREQGRIEELEWMRGELMEADLLALGALADRVRAAEVGDDVRIFTSGQADVTEDVVLVPPAAGLAFLRAVAVARITGPRGAKVRVDWVAVGLELAQVAIGFGANELVGVIQTKRGLPIADGELAGVGKKSQLKPADLVKKNELAGFIERSGRRASFVDEAASHRALPAGELA